MAKFFKKSIKFMQSQNSTAARALMKIVTSLFHNKCLLLINFYLTTSSNACPKNTINQ